MSQERQLTQSNEVSEHDATAMIIQAASIGAIDIIQKWELKNSIIIDTVFPNAAFHGHIKLCRWAYDKATDENNASFEQLWFEEIELLCESLFIHAAKTGDTVISDWLWPQLSDEIKNKLASHNDLYDYFYIAAKNGYVNVCKLITQYLPNTNFPSIQHVRSFDDSKHDALSMALHCQHQNVCQWLWDRMTKDEQYIFISGLRHYFETLFFGKKSFNVDLADWLLSKCSRENIIEDPIQLLFKEEFILSLKQSNLPLATWFLRNKLIDFDMDIFVVAVEYGQANICREIYENSDVMNQQDIKSRFLDFFYTCLDKYRSKLNLCYLQCIHLLVQVADQTGLNEALNMSLRHDTIDCTKLLLDAGADPNAPAPMQRFNSHYPLLESFITHLQKRDPNLYYRTQRLLISRGASLPLIKHLIQQDESYSNEQKQATLTALQQVEDKYVAIQEIVKASYVMNQGLLDPDHEQSQNPFQKLPNEIRCHIGFFCGSTLVSKEETDHLHALTTRKMKIIMTNPTSSYSLKIKTAKLEQALKAAEAKIAELESSPKRQKLDSEDHDDQLVMQPNYFNPPS